METWLTPVIHTVILSFFNVNVFNYSFLGVPARKLPGLHDHLHERSGSVLERLMNVLWPFVVTLLRPDKIRNGQIRNGEDRQETLNGLFKTFILNSKCLRKHVHASKTKEINALNGCLHAFKWWSGCKVSLVDIFFYILIQYCKNYDFVLLPLPSHYPFPVTTVPHRFKPLFNSLSQFSIV